jgi:hypothetical protein
MYQCWSKAKTSLRKSRSTKFIKDLVQNDGRGEEKEIPIMQKKRHHIKNMRCNSERGEEETERQRSI